MKKITFCLLALLITCTMWQVNAQTTSTGTINAPFPDNDPAGVDVPLVVTDNLTITDLNVDVEVIHSWVGDVSVTLTNPSGSTTVVLVDRVLTPGPDCSNDNMNVTLDDEAATPVELVCNPSTSSTAPYTYSVDGSHTPNNPLSAFDGQNTMGTWVLNVSDGAAFITGFVRSFSLTYTGVVAPPPPAGLVQFCATDNPQQIQDFMTVTSEVDVTDSGTIGAMTNEYVFDEALANLQHNKAGDLIFTLTSPEGTVFDLSSNNGGNDGLDAPGQDFILRDDSANGNVTGWTGAPTAADYIAEDGALNTAFDGEEINGIWTLTVADGGLGGQGNLRDFCLSFIANGVVGTPPIISCPGDIMADADPGQCSAVVSYGAPFAFDAEDTPNPTPVLVSGPETASGMIFPVGDTTVEYEVTDSDGNMDTCSFIVTVSDTQNPEAMCVGSITVELDAVTGMVSITPDMIDDGSMDNCGIDTYTLDIDTFDCSNIGDNTVVLTVTDDAGNMDTCTATVVVEDNTAPVITCQGEGITVTEDFNAGLPAGWSTVMNSGPDDWVNTDKLLADAYDAFGLEDDLPSNAMVVNDDGEGGAAAPANVSLLSDVYDMTGSTEATLSYDAILTGGTDFGSLETLTIEVYDGSAWVQIDQLTEGNTDASGAAYEYQSGSFDVSSYINADFQVRYTYDDAGEYAWGAAVDNFSLQYDSPLATPYMVDLGPDGTVTFPALNLIDGATDNCIGGVVVTNGPSTPISACGDNLGADIDNTLPPAESVASVTESGSTDDYAISVNVDITHTFDGDLTLVLTSPAGSTLELSSNNGGGGENYTNTVFADGNPSITTGSAPFTGSFSAEGGDFATAFAGEDITGDWTITVTDGAGGDEGTLDNFCISFAPLSGLMVTLDCSNLGENQIEITATDASGNTATCMATVIVSDITSPDIICVGQAGPNSGSASASPAVAIPDDTPAGISSTITVTDDFSIDDLNVDIDVTHTWVTDLKVTLESPAGTVVTLYEVATGCSGDDLSFTFDDEGTGDLATCNTGTVQAYPEDSYVPNNPLSAFDGEGTMGDWIMTISDNTGLDTGTFNAWGLTYDYMDPGTPLTVSLDENGMATITPDDVLLNFDDADPCGISTAVLDITDFDCDDAGTSVMVNVFVSDASGNIASCMAEVNIVDDMAPVLTCPGDQTVDSSDDTGQYVVPDYFDTGDATATDNCTDPVVNTQDPAPGTTFGVGATHPVTLTSTDEAGNVSTCTFNVEVTFLSVQDNAFENAISMYPNPASSQVTIANKSNIALQQAMIYDINGKLVNQINLSTMQGEKVIDVSALSSGVYMVRIIGEQASVVKRLIKK